jgi:diguanylate cyclase (GGDEF)-like protein
MATSVLVVEDSEVVRSAVIESLKSAGLFDTYYEARDGREGVRIISSTPVDLAICDVMMPDMDGLEFLTTVRGTKELQDIPVIMLSERSETSLKIRTLGIGARDYITKPFDPGELAARIAVHLRIKTLQDEMRRTNQLLREISITDHLTHLYNRRYVMDVLATEFQRTLRTNGELCLVLIDVDHFKAVNDTYGHQCGDLVLAALAEALQVELRCYDVAARYGGEEFAVLLPGTSLQRGREVGERLRQAVTEISFPHPMAALCVTISLGIAALPCARIDSVDALIRAADEALYRAKQNGRNRVEVTALAETGFVSEARAGE